MSGRAITLLRFSLLVAPLALLPAVSCKSGGGGGGGGNALANTLLACGLLSAGQLPAEASTTEPYENCVAQCLASSTCAELEALICGADFEVQEACSLQCIETHGFACADGQRLYPFFACDGSADCADGSDELNCPAPFACGDGSEIPPDWKCDGYVDCENGSDEDGCPAMSTFMCGSGEQLPASSKCDFVADCNDGSDEAGCAMVICPDDGPNGTTGPDPIETTGETGL
jgi:hypothetical protein